MKNLGIRTFALTVVLMSSLAASALAATLPELFQRGKEEFKAGNYKASLATFDELDAASLLPGKEADRAKLASIILFYRGVNLAALGRRDEAAPVLRTYLKDNPGAQISDKDYPKKVVSLFEELRAEKAKSGQNAIAASYAAFAADSSPLPVDESWAEGPVRYYLSSDDNAKWKNLPDAAARTAFVEDFWRRNDPSPATPENELRREYDRRARFAEKQFASEKTPGKLSDRALVFALLGPPTLAGRSQLQEGDDAMDSLRTSTQGQGLSAGHQTAKSASSDKGFGTGHGMREVWTYRRDRMPAGVKYQEVNFVFVTREGYGEGVLQRDHRSMTTLDAAKNEALTR